MTLKERLEADYKKAFKGKNEVAVETLRLLKAEVKNEEIAKREDFDDNKVLDVVMKVSKKHKDSSEAFKKGKREDLAAKEKEQLAVLEEYLPDKLSEEELRDIICEMIEEADAKTPKDFGKVMGIIMKKVKNQADGNLVSKILKEELEKKSQQETEDSKNKENK
ncbi:MAG: GatB/YqeY domain-containing protein [Patescibacteria group bacterium]|nr:GatB/YqeY domain-containing protein [Patescibacteria group bacterium]